MGTDLAAALSETLGTISGQLRLRFAASGVDDSGLGFVALATLRHLARHGPKTITELAELDHVTTQAISLRVAPLVHNELVERRRDPDDARRTILSVSAAGGRTLAAAQDRAHHALEEALACLGAEELDEVRRALPALDHLATALRSAHTSV